MAKILIKQHGRQIELTDEVGSGNAICTTPEFFKICYDGLLLLMNGTRGHVINVNGRLARVYQFNWGDASPYPIKIHYLDTGEASQCAPREILQILNDQEMEIEKANTSKKELSGGFTEAE